MPTPFRVRVNGTPLDPEEWLESGIVVEASDIYHDLDTAKQWGLTPSQWYGEPHWSRAAMRAYCKWNTAIRSAASRLSINGER